MDFEVEPLPQQGLLTSRSMNIPYSRVEETLQVLVVTSRKPNPQVSYYEPRL
jgi:hypothetical protein